MTALLERPALARALLMVAIVDEAISRDWIANVGGRRADQRLAHFLCEWHARLSSVGLARSDECEFVLTQPQIGDVLGMTAVHVNRSLQVLRTKGMISLRERRLTILNASCLKLYGGFKDRYLQTAH